VSLRDNILRIAKAPLCDNGQNLLCRNIDLRYPRAYVDDGGELVVIGGPDSDGVGGFTSTALDDVLPVSMTLPQRKDTPSVAVALIIEDLATQSNVNISKVAGEGVLKLLTPADRVAVNEASGTDASGGRVRGLGRRCRAGTGAHRTYAAAP
jgi:hypothetical protein